MTHVPRSAPCQVRLHRLEEMVVVEEAVHLDQHGVHLQAQARDPLEEVDPVVAIAQHGGFHRRMKGLNRFNGGPSCGVCTEN